MRGLRVISISTMRLTLSVYFFCSRIFRTLLNRPPVSLRVLLSGGFVLLLLLLMGLLSFVVELIATRHVQMDTRSTLSELAATMSDRLDHNIFERQREIKLLASMYEQMDNQSPDRAAQRAVLASIQENYPDYAWLGFVDNSGKVVAATDGAGEGVNVAQRTWFQKGLIKPTVADATDDMLGNSSKTSANGDSADPQLAIQQPILFITLAAPVLSTSGDPIGVLAAQINWESAREIKTSVFRPVDTESLVETFVFRGNGELILAPPTWQTLHVYSPIYMTALVNSLANRLEARDSQSDSDILNWLDEGRYVVGYAQNQGYRTFPGLGWIVIVRQPLNRAFASIPLLQRLIYLTGGLSIILFGFAAWLLTGRLTRQLQAISNAAERIRRGDPTVSLPLLSGSSEIATLSSSLHQLVEDLTTATTAERNRIARDLHDSVTQTLFSASLLADVMPKLWETDPQRGRSKMEELRRSVRGALAEMRTLLLELRPAALVDAEMSRLLRQLADATMGRSGIVVDWQLSGNCEPPPDVKIVFYRTVQEALNNIIKHSQASKADVTLRCDTHQAILSIADDGHGFDPDKIPGDHLGLQMMRERIVALGGTLQIHSQVNQGTEIHVVLKRREDDIRVGYKNG